MKRKERNLRLFSTIFLFTDHRGYEHIILRCIIIITGGKYFITRKFDVGKQFSPTSSRFVLIFNLTYCRNIAVCCLLTSCARSLARSLIFGFLLYYARYHLTVCIEHYRASRFVRFPPFIFHVASSTFV